MHSWCGQSISCVFRLEGRDNCSKEMNEFYVPLTPYLVTKRNIVHGDEEPNQLQVLMVTLRMQPLNTLFSMPPNCSMDI
ncbi:hypothetical protein PVAP13_6KG228412 [Panicum virgatum]|uniref:Uncharacterized protein n=1 Tax=Panicum virgatum TaxID=38727 RepID=A0A8T0RCE0_PANVG|nr:hypothetical protein PVAP13_6KG228412 [Panicum virgatum]